MKKKDMKRSLWTRPIKRRYLSKKIYYENEIIGVCGIIYLDEVKSKLIKKYEKEEVITVDNNYKWIQIALFDKNYWITAMYDDKNILKQIYIDITKENVFDDMNNPYFIDLYCDIVITNENIYILDEDELDDAYSNLIITKEEYDLSKKVTNNVYNYVLNNREKIFSYCKNILEYLLK